MWYLPHYPVKHPLKPGKGEAGSWLSSKVWTNITSSWWHRSNVSPIHGGPKRLWHFFNLKKFVWWLNRDLVKKMREYRMGKHLFGATSSQSVANFCPRKTDSPVESRGVWCKSRSESEAGLWADFRTRRGKFRALKARAAEGVWGQVPPRKFWNLEAQKCSSKHFPWHFRKVNLRRKSRRSNC